jgi:hypothetical protein
MTVRSKLLTLGVLAALSGCAFFERLDERSPVAAAPSAAEGEADVPVPGSKPKPPLEAALPPPAAPPIEPAELEQLTPEQTTDLLGEPTYRSERGSGVVWSYVRPGCELDLVFFMNVQTKVSRVLDYDLRASDGTERSRQRCLEQLASERRSRGSGSSTRPR